MYDSSYIAESKYHLTYVRWRVGVPPLTFKVEGAPPKEMADRLFRMWLEANGEYAQSSGMALDTYSFRRSKGNVHAYLEDPRYDEGGFDVYSTRPNAGYAGGKMLFRFRVVFGPSGAYPPTRVVRPRSETDARPEKRDQKETRRITRLKKAEGCPACAEAAKRFQVLCDEHCTKAELHRRERRVARQERAKQKQARKEKRERAKRRAKEEQLPKEYRYKGHKVITRNGVKKIKLRPPVE